MSKKLSLLSKDLAEVFADGMSHFPKSPRQTCTNLGQFQSRTATFLLAQHGLQILRTESCIEYPIDFLFKNGKISKKIQDAMHVLRLSRNRAEHPEKPPQITPKDAEDAVTAAQEIAEFICSGVPDMKLHATSSLSIPASVAVPEQSISKKLDALLVDFKEKMKIHASPFTSDPPHVFWSASVNPSYLIVGKNPGKEEEKSGIPFTGKSGELLDTLLSKIGLKQDQFHITNVVKACLPSKTPLSDIQLEYYKPLLDEEIRIVSPKKILCLGHDAFKLMSGEINGEFKIHRGKVFSFHGIPTIPTYHPIALHYAHGEPWERSMTRNTEQDFSYFRSL